MFFPRSLRDWLTKPFMDKFARTPAGRRAIKTRPRLEELECRLAPAAAAVLDQGFDPAGHITLSAGFGGINTHQERAQTFQVGKTGALAEVDVLARRFDATANGSLMFELRRTDANGAPSNVAADVLLQKAIPSASVSASLTTFLVVDTSAANLQVTAGQRLAIVLYASADTTSGVTYQWNGQNNNPYPSGNEWEQVIGNHAWVGESNASFDLGFRTYVAPAAPPAPTVALANATQSLAENAGTFSVTVTLSAAATTAVSIPFTLGGTAVSGTNYVNVTASPLVIAAGQTAATITGTLIDSPNLPNKTITITLGTPTNATLGATTTDTITIQPVLPPRPPLPTLIINNVNQLEGTSGLTAFNFRVSLRTAPTKPITYDVFTTDRTAVAGTNYVGIAAGMNAPHAQGMVTFAPGQVTQTVTVYVMASSVPVSAGAKAFDVSLSDPAQPAKALATATGTIIPQAPSPTPAPPAVLISNVAGLEGTNGLTPFTFRVILPRASTKPVTFDVFTTDGTAQAGKNYIGIVAGVNADHSQGTVTFAPGQVMQIVTVYVIAGSITPSAGVTTFTVILSDPASPTVPLASGVAHIIPQLTKPNAAVLDKVLAELAGGL